MSEKIIDEVMGLVSYLEDVLDERSALRVPYSRVEMARSAIRAKLREVLERRPLSDEEISSIAAGPCWSEDGVDIYMFARALEKQHQIGAE